MDAYLDGLERARQAGRDLSRIESVASFFVSRVDAEIDARLDKIGTPEAQALRGTAAIAQRPAGLRALRAGVLLRPVGVARGRQRVAAATAVGVHRGQGSYL
jgi:hypothetical protein